MSSKTALKHENSKHFIIYVIKLLGWQQSHFVFMIFKASLLIQITNINQLCINHFV